MNQRDTRPVAGRPALRLRALSPAPLDSECALPAEGLVIGRDPDRADVVLYSARISRQHCRIRAAGKGWEVEDLDSTNGVYVNGQRIEQERMLTVGDVIGLGRADPPDFELITAGGNMRSVTLPAAERWTIGRALDCDIALPVDPTVSQRHAELRCEQGRLTIRDLGSLNGVRINGRSCGRKSAQALEDEEWLELGNSRLAVLRLDNGGILVTIAGRSPGLRLETRELVDSSAGVDALELSIEPGVLTGILAHDRRRSSDLLELLSGRRNPDGGSVLYDGVPVDATVHRRRHRIGHVDILPPLDASLTVWHHLRYTAELRLPTDMSPGRRESLLGTTLAQLGLGRLRNVKIGRLDVAHRRLVAIAAELVTRPALLCLDRPLDGLDDDQSRTLLRRLRQLARTGTTVVVTGVDQAADHHFDRLIEIDEQPLTERPATGNRRARSPSAPRGTLSLHRIRTLLARQCRLRLFDPGMLTLYVLLPVLLTLAASALAEPYQPLETVMIMMMVAMATAVFTAAPEIGADRWRLRHEVLSGVLPGEDLFARLSFLWLIGIGQVLLVGSAMAWLSGMTLAEGTAMIGIMALVAGAAAALGLMVGTIDPTHARLVMPLAAALVVLQWIVATGTPPAGGEIIDWLFGRIRELLPAWWGMELYAAHQGGLEQETRRAIRAAAFLAGQIITWMLIARALLGRRLRQPIR